MPGARVDHREPHCRRTRGDARARNPHGHRPARQRRGRRNAEPVPRRDGLPAHAVHVRSVPGGGLDAAVRAIAEAEPGIVLHCVAGRDRTGIVVATVLAAIGVPEEEIVADYVDEGIAKRAWVMGQVLVTLRDAFGGAAAYLRLAGVTGVQVDAIRAKLLA